MLASGSNHEGCFYYECFMNPQHLLYSQNGISSEFKRGGEIRDALFDVCSGGTKVLDFPRMEVFLHRGLWFSADNRRLWVFKSAGVTLARVRRTYFNESHSRKLDTRSHGQVVHIRPKRERSEQEGQQSVDTVSEAPGDPSGINGSHRRRRNTFATRRRRNDRLKWRRTPDDDEEEN